MHKIEVRFYLRPYPMKMIAMFLVGFRRNEFIFFTYIHSCGPVQWLCSHTLFMLLFITPNICFTSLLM